LDRRRNGPADTAMVEAETPVPPQTVRRAAALRRAALRAVGGLGRAALAAVLPPTCVACRRPVAVDATLCADCWSRVRFLERPYCERLGTPFAFDLGDGAVSPAAI